MCAGVARRMRKITYFAHAGYRMKKHFYIANSFGNDPIVNFGPK